MIKNIFLCLVATVLVAISSVIIWAFIAGGGRIEIGTIVRNYYQKARMEELEKLNVPIDTSDNQIGKWEFGWESNRDKNGFSAGPYVKYARKQKDCWIIPIDNDTDNETTNFSATGRPYVGNIKISGKWIPITIYDETIDNSTKETERSTGHLVVPLN